MEASTISKTAQSESRNSEAFISLSTGQTSPADIFFPFLDSMNQKVRLPNWISLIFFVYWAFQLYCVALWPQVNTFINVGSTEEEFLWNIQYGAFIFQRNNTFEDIFFIIATVLFAVSLIFFIFQYMYHKRNRKIIGWTLYPTRILTELLPVVILHPLFYHIAIMITNPERAGSFAYLYMVFYIIYALFFVIVFLYCGLLNSFSAYLQSGFLSTFDILAFAFLALMDPVILALVQAFQSFPDWFCHPILFIHLSLLVYIFTLMSEFPFVNKTSNVIFDVIVICAIVLDALSFISLFFSNLNINWIETGTSIAVIVVCSVSVSIWQNFQMKKVRRGLAYNGETNLVEMDNKEDIVVLNDEEKRERFNQLGFDTSPRKCRFYMRAGLAQICDMLCDLSLIRYVIDMHPTTDMIALCLRIVAYFPPEIRLMNVILGMLMKKRDLKITHRFLIYQVHRIKILRQSSSSRMATEKMLEMKQLVKASEASIVGFWSRTDNTISTFADVQSEINRMKSLWDETLNDYPNSPAFRDEYSRFLIECATDFTSAIYQRNMRELIDGGRNFSIDYCYRSLIQCYPNYLKKKIFDVKGNYIKSTKNRTKNGSQVSSMSSHSSHGAGSEMSSNQIDARREEELGRAIITNAKTRLALQHATDDRKANSSSMMCGFAGWSAVLGLGVCIFLLAYDLTVFAGRKESIIRTQVVTDNRIQFALSSLMTMMNWATSLNKYDNTSLSEAALKEELNYFVDLNKSFEWLAMDATIGTRNKLSEFLTKLTDMALDGANVYPTGGPLMTDGSKAYFCRKGEVLEPRMTNMRILLMQQAYRIGIINAIEDRKEWMNISTDGNPLAPSTPDKPTANDDLCSMEQTIKTISDDYTLLINSLFNNAIEEANVAGNVFLYIMIGTAAGYAVLYIAPFIFVSVKYINELKSLLRMMHEIEAKYRQQAMLPIRKTNSEENNATPNDRQTHASSMIVYIVFIIFLALGFTGWIVGIMEYVLYMNSRYATIRQWNTYSNMRAGMVIEAVHLAYMAIWLNNDNSRIGTLNSSQFVTRLNTMTTTIRSYYRILQRGDGNIEGWVGADDELDALINTDSCEAPPIATTLHDMYYCGSAAQVQNFLISTFDDMIEKIDTYGSAVTDEKPVNVFHIVFGHLLPKLDKISIRLDVILENEESYYSTIIIVLFVVGLVISGIGLWILVSFITYLNQSYRGALALLRRVTPAGIVGADELIGYLMHREKATRSGNESTSASIIRNSNDAIICTGIGGTIENVNTAVTQLFGYTPEQLLGQNFTIILPKADQEKTVQQMQMMKDKQSAMTYEGHITCLTDTDGEVPCHAIILGMQDESENVKSFVIIIRNEEELLRQQEEAEAAKKQSEQLLYQILPRDIVTRLNAGEKDVTFTVKSASVMFIDIVKFSEYSAQLSPQEIMGNLGMLFAAFDEAIANYPLLTKIKLIGDVYMCAAGLFSPDEPPQSHCEQIIRFGFEALQALDEINIKLNANLQVRIGVNTGGPLLAGILGTDKPVFDIIGDTINVASRLQSTDVPGHIQISQASYDLVKDLEFDIEPRGEIFLKGKGKQQAYLVKPISQNAMMSFTLASSHDDKKDFK